RESSRHPMGVAITLEARGDVAAEAAKNPHNFLESGGSLHLFQGRGGINPAFQNDDAFLTALDNAQTAAGEIAAAPNWRSDPRWINSARMVSTNLAPQFFWDLAAHGTLESDQKFSHKQYSYGLKLGLVYRDWTDQHWSTKFNLLDYPFAALRWLSKTEDDFQLSVRAIPVIVAGVDAVSPAANSTRLAVDPDSSVYPRSRIELQFRTRALRWKVEDLWFSANFRYFQEFGASAPLRAAHLDASEYFSAKLDLPYHFNVSYSTGKLPLDQSSSQVYALGWSLNF
ncbi:MAG TPA: hypothetical protein VFV83_07640, partial [Chthoniobacteraceae bacterium]|nr:hypothetical protein [Chthoniobacteraceae bacterium]